jgi:hypothetical protein
LLKAGRAERGMREPVVTVVVEAHAVVVVVWAAMEPRVVAAARVGEAAAAAAVAVAVGGEAAGGARERERAREAEVLAGRGGQRSPPRRLQQWQARAWRTLRPQRARQ